MCVVFILGESACILNCISHRALLFDGTQERHREGSHAERGNQGCFIEDSAFYDNFSSLKTLVTSHLVNYYSVCSGGCGSVSSVSSSSSPITGATDTTLSPAFSEISVTP